MRRVARALAEKFGPRNTSAPFALRALKKTRSSRYGRFVTFKHFSTITKKQQQVPSNINVNALAAQSSFIRRRRLLHVSRTRPSRLRHYSRQAPHRLHRKRELASTKFNFQATREKVSVSDRLLKAVGSEAPSVSL